ncbi:MAG: dienelactone hydrolase family protein [Chloroflexota bacterium]
MALLTQTAVPTSVGRSISVAIATPDRGAEAPGAAVLVIHEALGLNDDIRRIASRIADDGYIAVVPDFLGAGWKPLCIARFMQRVGRVGRGRPYRDLAAVQRWLGRRPDVDSSRIGVAGFCLGGGFAILYAARGGEPVRALAPFYAAVPKDEDVLDGLCPTVASYGGRDRMFGRQAARLEAALERRNVPHDVKVYPEASHSFMSRHSPRLEAIERRVLNGAGYHEPSAEDAWRRMLAFFDLHLRAEGGT